MNSNVTVPTVPIERFGKDHWALLAYIETCAVDGHQGVAALDKRRLRCNDQRHPVHAVNRYTIGPWNPEFGTRLSGYFQFEGRGSPHQAAVAGVQILAHDDWDCMDDLEAAGLIDVLSEANAAVLITADGSAIAAQLRSHKAQGGAFADFVLHEAIEEAA